ncbi:MAG: ATP-binding cassette domain-containing protein [Betaproteobacteria bacterium]|nr:MAG: ATP-binding cassette domain-containing protein [Betaproteobacteria bacterium]
MLRISNLSLSRGVKLLLDDASLTVHPGHKLGLIGANGSGKSSLFALLRGELSQDKGELSMPPGWVIAHVAQETAPAEGSAIDYVLDGDRELRIIERALAVAQADEAADAHTSGELLAELHHRFEIIDGYSARARASTLLSGLGFPAERHDNPVTTFSGGWRMRLNLAQALMCRSDLLLLDEPTNHLDLDAVLWLEDWLEHYPGTLLLVTHDRDFLDAVATEIAHLDQRKLRHYTGNYAQFERERAQALALQQSAYVKQQRQIAHLRSYIDRFRAKATKAKQAQSRIKTLERMEMIAAAHVDSPFSFELKAHPTAARQLLKLEHVSLGYGGAPVLENVDWAILAGERIGLLGPNGAGKSTLLRAIADELTPRSGSRLAANGLRIGYFAQHQVEQLRLDESAMWHMQRLEPATRDQALRDFLGSFDFRGERASSPVRDFSGGEKARLTLALLARQKPNLLLLDEPTNHLDIDMREALTEALQDYTGALIVVAHDRHLLRATADELWLVAEGSVSLFDGDLDDYRRWVLTGRTQGEASVARAGGAPPAADRRTQKRAEATARQQVYALRKPLADKLAQIEKDMDAIGAERETIEAWLTKPDAYGEEGKHALRDTIARQGDLTWQLARLEAEWLEVSEALEKIGS